MGLDLVVWHAEKPIQLHPARLKRVSVNILISVIPCLIKRPAQLVEDLGVFEGSSHIMLPRSTRSLFVPQKLESIIIAADEKVHGQGKNGFDA